MENRKWSASRERKTAWTVCLQRALLILVTTLISFVQSEKIPLPRFQDLRAHYPGYSHHGGQYRNHELYNMIGIEKNNNLLLHDTSALRLSYSLNQIGGVHSLGKEMIHFSRFGHDSIQGKDQLQYIFLPISFGPYLADKYGYPNISKLHQVNPVQTKHTFWGKQGILRVITYTNHGNQPKGHVALWDCYHFHQSKDWISGNSLLTVEFWESPDSDCSEYSADTTQPITIIPLLPVKSDQSKSALQNENSQSKLLSILKDSSIKSKAKYLKHLIMPTNARHSSKKQRLKNKLKKLR
ncbi:uncharacterized protein LOC123546859 [Mercenaria mercenaria]|uniref:uncharacterized protein LOC123546859 n=1 Tax=Mercenaria mercenaria TaxID=6596 RepID=UPI001E1D8252|nr:uncharacterized protein LOC123546859 [Mercenaria mercenaria]